MLLPYVITLIIVIALLGVAVRAHFFFGLHRVIKTETREEAPYVARTSPLHKLIFSVYS
jgi:hypothetical protein